MRARTSRRRAQPIGRAAPRVRHASRAALVYLRGRDADGRLRELAERRAGARPVLGELAIALLDGKAHEALGFRSVADWSRERIGVGARTVREWARVARSLAELPLLRRAVRNGEVSWTVARLVVKHTTPENEQAVLATVRGRTVRAIEILLRAAFPSETGDGDDEQVTVSVSCAPEVEAKWIAAQELARRVAGEELPLRDCAEAVAAECASALPFPERRSSRASQGRRPGSSRRDARESPFRVVLWPHLRGAGPSPRGSDLLVSLGDALHACSPRRLDRRFRLVIAFLQEVDFETGRVLRQVLERKLYLELGFESFERYVTERLDLSPSTAGRLVRLARAERTAPAVVTAFRAGRITAMQALVLLRGDGTEADVALAERVMLRRLEDELPQRKVEFRAPPEVAALFVAFVRSVGLEAMLDHAIATWLQAGAAFKDYADFERDGFRCTVPGCTRRRNLHSHHIRFRSARGPDVAWNRTTLCAWHHGRGVHEGRIGVRGRAPEALVYELGVGTYRSGDVAVA